MTDISKDRVGLQKAKEEAKRRLQLAQLTLNNASYDVLRWRDTIAFLDEIDNGSTGEETFWLIERKSTPKSWKTDSSRFVGGFTSDIEHAYRFKTEKAAAECLREMGNHFDRIRFTVVGHVWINSVHVGRADDQKSCGKCGTQTG